ncbi:transmembrane protein 72-like [Tubulanus polymorphus]|uniref:transmembrane protein 72-like n=1 Tax=Tubulanus polymorphus TaxID=672921 RepID=UPI003DA40656
MAYNRAVCRCTWEYYVWLPRTWSILTATGLWGVGCEILTRRHPLGAYILVVAILMSFLEVVFAVNICIVLCMRDENPQFISFWKNVLWIDDWRKGFLYLVLSVGCFTQPHIEWLAVVSGVMMVISGILYSVKTYKTRLDEKMQQLLRQDNTYDRFDELSVDLNDQDFQRSNIIINNSVLVHDIMQGHISVPSDDDDSFTDSVGIAEQDEILEV